MFKVNTTPNMELIEKWDNDSGVFYRFQNPEYEIKGEYTQSWGMIFSSAEEARECAEEWGMDEDEAVLPGKSCWDTLKNLMAGDLVCQFSDTDVVLVFKGVDTGAEGHDGEYVAEYIAPIAVLSIQDVLEYCKKELWQEE